MVQEPVSGARLPLSEQSAVLAVKGWRLKPLQHLFRGCLPALLLRQWICTDIVCRRIEHTIVDAIVDVFIGGSCVVTVGGPAIVD